MKYLVALSAVLLAASALPTDIGNAKEDEGFIVNSETFNATFFNARNAPGFSVGNIGGQGGAVWTVWDPWALRSAINSATPRIIHINGRIDLTLLFESSPGVVLHCGPYKTFIGTDRTAEIYGGGLRLTKQVHVIFQNIKFTNPISYAQNERPNGNGGIISQTPGAFSVIDALDLDGSERIWIDHCEFSDDPWNAAATPESQRRHDGLVDMKQGASWITISNSIFRNHNLVSLIGHSDDNAAQDVGRLRVTYMLNWFRGTVQRNPRVRYGQVHILNNLYSDIIDYGIGAGAGAHVHIERNVFRNTRRAWGFPSGTPNPIGNVVNDNNLLVSSSFDANIPSNVNFRPSSYYSYSPMATANLESYIQNNAGPR